MEIEITKTSPSFFRFSSSDVSEINEQIRVLEPESFHPHSLFDSSVKLTNAKILLALDSLTIGIFRKCRQMVQNEENGIKKRNNYSLSGSSSGSKESIWTEDDFENDAEARENLFNFILANPKLSEDVKSLAKWSLQLRQDFLSVFQLHAEDFKAAKETLRSASVSRITNPHIHRRGFKAPPPRGQLKYELSAKPSYNATMDPEGIIRSYEIGFLVPVLKTVSNFLTEALRNLILENIENKWNVKFPKRIWGYKINLRFLAAYPNIFFIILCWMILKIVFKIIF